MRVLSTWGLIVVALGVLATLIGLLLMVLHSLAIGPFADRGAWYAVLFLLGICTLLSIAGGIGLGHRFVSPRDPH